MPDVGLPWTPALGRMKQTAKASWRWIVDQLDPASSQRPGRDFSNILGHLTPVIWFLLFLGAFALATVAMSYLRTDKLFTQLFLEITQSVSREHFFAVMLTAAASTFAFVVSVTAGYVTGLGAAVLVRSKTTRLRIVGGAIFQLMEMLYVVPVVATMSLVIAFLTVQFHDGARWMIAVGAISIAAIALGGYQVFEAVFRSAILRKSPIDS